MNTSLQAMDQSAQAGSVGPFGSATEHKLPRAGRRPLVFNGTELAMAMSFSPNLPYWFEINLYHTEAQEFAVAIRKFYQSEDETDHIRSWSFPNLEAALGHIETYDAAIDILIPEMDLETMMPAEMSAVALALKAEVEGVRHHYRGLVGELFMEMEQAENSIG